MDIGTESEPYVIEPIVEPVPALEPTPEYEPSEVPEKVPA